MWITLIKMWITFYEYQNKYLEFKISNMFFLTNVDKWITFKKLSTINCVCNMLKI